MSKAFDPVRAAWDYCDNEHGFDDPCEDCKHLARGFAAARLAAIREVRAWAEREAYGGGEDDNGHVRCATIDLPEMLAKLAEMERG